MITTTAMIAKTYRAEVWINNGAQTHEEYNTNRLKLLQECVALMKKRHVCLSGHTSSVTVYDGDTVIYDYILTDNKTNCKRFYGHNP